MPQAVGVQLGEGGGAAEEKETSALLVCSSWLGLYLLHVNFVFSFLPHLFFSFFPPISIAAFLTLACASSLLQIGSLPC